MSEEDRLTVQATSVHPPEDQPAPIDWPDRFRTAADVAEGEFEIDATAVLDDVAWRLERMPLHVVEAIGRALLGEDGGQDR